MSETDRAYPRDKRASAGAPNVVVVLVDDLGYSDIGPFGSEISTPNLDKLAQSGVRFANYHTAPLCSPARAALLTGLNPHRAGYGGVANSDPGLPALRLEIGDDVLTLPEILRSAGYATFGIGKWHLTRDALMHDGADRSSWPLQRGFDRYYGTLEGCNSFFHPNRLIRDNSALDVEQFPSDYYLTDDLTREAISMVKGLRANDPSKPFFLYFAHHAMHGPLGAKDGDLRKYRGRYEEGWDRVRERRHGRQLADGLFPSTMPLAPRNSEPGFDVPAWDSLDPGQRAVFSRHMEVYAAMVDSVDQSLGKLLDTIDELGELENTIVVFTSDNGATREGGPEGTRSYFSRFVHVAGLPTDWNADVERDLDLLGGPQAMIHYPRGWGMTSNTPFRFYKGQTYAGGVRVPLIFSWPAGVQREKGDDGIRQQYQYVTDVLPTLLDLLDVEQPAERQGRPAQPVDGSAFTSTISSGDAPSTHREQYAECGGNRGFYRDGWKLVTQHEPGQAFDDDEWELYDLAADPNELVDLGRERPGMVKELAAAWEEAAWANTVFPLSDSRSMPALRRPAEKNLEAPVTLLPGTPTLERYRSSRLITMRSFDIAVDLHHWSSAEGVLVSHGDQGGGYVLYVRGGDLHLAYNEYGAMRDVHAGRLDAGTRRIVLRAQWLPGFRWRLRLEVDGEERGGLDSVWMLLGLAPFSGIDVGLSRGGPVSWVLYASHGSFPYTGNLRRVTFAPGEKADYDPETIAEAESDVARYYD